VYLNSFLEKQFNLQYSHRFKDWSSLLAVHSTQPANRVDQDDDRFIDLPLLRRYSVYNKWQKGNEAEWGFHSKIAWSYLDESRVGGQIDFDPQIHEGKNQVYGQTVDIQQPSVYTKTGFRIDDVHYFNVIASAFYQDQKSYYGLARYRGKQLNAYANLQYEYAWKEKHNLKTGFSYRYQRLEENIGFNDDVLNRTYDGLYLKKESIPGLFAENTFNWLDRKLVLITGLRADHHQDFGWHWTPRALVKYQLG
ncbi:MAG: TonB-dependent receptor, partial [Bacteroidota bacterium]